MNYDPPLLEQVPAPIIASARLVCEWFDANAEGEWALGGLCSRSMFEESERQRKQLAEVLRECAEAIGPAGHPAAVNSTLWAKAKTVLAASPLS